MPTPEFRSRSAQLLSWLLLLGALGLFAFSVTERCPRGFTSFIQFGSVAWTIYCLSARRLPFSVNQFIVFIAAGVLASGLACVAFWNNPAVLLAVPGFLLLLLVFVFLLRSRFARRTSQLQPRNL